MLYFCIVYLPKCRRGYQNESQVTSAGVILVTVSCKVIQQDEILEEDLSALFDPLSNLHFPLNLLLSKSVLCLKDQE